MRAREFIFEAAYDSMVASMKQKFPDQAAIIDQWVKWSKVTLKKADRVTWFLKVLRANLTQTLGPKELGTYQFTDMQKLANDIGHFYGIEYPPIHDYIYKDQTVSQIISDLRQLESKWQSAQTKTKGVPVGAGDYKLFEFGDGTAWWWVDRAYCPEEGRSGGHCGNVVGQQKTDQRILSLRNKQNQVICTFILEPDGTLGEMKAVNNLKPSEKYHPHILKLLLWDRIKGIASTKYQYNPGANFNVFDLNEQQLLYLDQVKPDLIISQIKSFPTSAIRMPDSIKDKYGPVLNQIDPALGTLLKDNSIRNWEYAVSRNPGLIIHAPTEIRDWREKVVSIISGVGTVYDDETGESEFGPLDDGLEDLRDTLLIQAPAIISKDPSIVKDIVSREPETIRQVNPNIRDYATIAEMAIRAAGRLLPGIPEEYRTAELCRIAVKDEGSVLEFVPKQFITPELSKLAVMSNGAAIKWVPEKFQSDVMFKLAVKRTPSSLKYIPEEYRTVEICELAASTSLASAKRWIPPSMLTRAFYEKVLSVNPLVLPDVPFEYVTDDSVDRAIKANPSIITNLDDRLKTLDKWALAYNSGLSIKKIPHSIVSSVLKYKKQ